MFSTKRCDYISSEVSKLSKLSHDLSYLSLRIKELVKLEFIILGDQFDRVIFIKTTESSALIFSINRVFKDTYFYTKFISSLEIEENGLSWAKIIFEEGFDERLLKPQVFFIGLYHKEVFPLPRFHLALADLATPLRSNIEGSVRLFDMQLDIHLSDIKQVIDRENPEIVAMSMTFGQQGLFEEIVEHIINLDAYNPLVIVGGSLANLNYEHICKQYREVIVARGAGETTMLDLVSFWKGSISIKEVNNISYWDTSKEMVLTTSMHTNDRNTSVWPELDLLPLTLAKDGVMQLESSRGCTYFCSFCPRDHKGRWSNNFDSFFDEYMKRVSSIYAEYPKVSRRLFLVDEEFIGYTGDEKSFARALKISDTIKKNNFTFESSTRIDQVYRPYKNEEWHIKRISFWKGLKNNGLQRMLFGVESGVDSILKRFNKQTTANQNKYAIRLLTAIGVPIRLTYITFDPLMSMEELIESYMFLGSTDIVLNELPSISEKELFDGILSEKFCQNNKSGTPLYQKISYLLVSMEALNGSPYTKVLETEGLIGDFSSSMGRRKVLYKDYRIGLMSYCCQLWIDRNFTLDYTLKSYQKITKTKAEWSKINLFRIKLKEHSFILLGEIISLFTGKRGTNSIPSQLHVSSTTQEVAEHKEAILRLMNLRKIILERELDLILRECSKLSLYKIVKDSLQEWLRIDKWQLIND